MKAVGCAVQLFPLPIGILVNWTDVPRLADRFQGLRYRQFPFSIDNHNLDRWFRLTWFGPSHHVVLSFRASHSRQPLVNLDKPKGSSAA